MIGISSYTIKYEGFLNKAANSLQPKQVITNDYWAVYIGGGYGPLFDVANNKDLQLIIAKIYQSNGVIGSGGHGAGALANVTLSSGKFLVEGKKISGFPDSTENLNHGQSKGLYCLFWLRSS